MIDTNAIITLGITNVISGIFIGLGIATGSYLALKSQMPRWIHEISLELRKNQTLSRMEETRRKYA